MVGMDSVGKCADSPAALSGMKMRSQESKIHLDTFKSFGSTPVSMTVAEVMSGLQTGVVDGFSNTPIFSFATSWTSAVDHFTYTKHLYQPGIIVASKKWFDKLTPDLQKIILDDSPERRGINSVRAITKPILGNFEAMNIKVCPTNAEGQAAFKKAAQGVWKRFAARSSANARMLKLVKAAKAKFK